MVVVGVRGWWVWWRLVGVVEVGGCGGGWEVEQVLTSGWQLRASRPLFVRPTWIGLAGTG